MNNIDSVAENSKTNSAHIDDVSKEVCNTELGNEEMFRQLKGV